MFNRLSVLVKLASERFSNDETIVDEVYEKARKMIIRAAVKELLFGIFEELNNNGRIQQHH